MIDLTPLDVRNKRGDFKKIMRGYDPAEVDVFLELAAERLEVLVRENLQLRERTQTLQNQVDAQVGVGVVAGVGGRSCEPTSRRSLSARQTTSCGRRRPSRSVSSRRRKPKPGA